MHLTSHLLECERAFFGRNVVDACFGNLKSQMSPKGKPVAQACGGVNPSVCTDARRARRKLAAAAARLPAVIAQRRDEKLASTRPQKWIGQRLKRLEKYALVAFTSNHNAIEKLNRDA